MSTARPGPAFTVPPPIPSRGCDGCDVCCVALTIREPTLKKAQGFRCPNLVDGPACGIYPDRPHTCRSFECGWRRVPWVAEELRPDRSGILFRLVTDPEIMVVLTVLEERGLDAPGLAESVASPIAAGIPLLLEVPSRPGYTSATAPIGPVLLPFLEARDKPGLLRTLRQCWRKGKLATKKAIRVKA